MTATPLELVYLSIALVAGAVGAMVGVGGGVILIPALTVMGVDVRLAVGASLISVIATSSGAAAAYVRERLTNVRVAIFLEMFTTSGALVGAIAQGWISSRVLSFLFAGALVLSGAGMVYKMLRVARTESTGGARDFAARLGMNASYRDPATGKRVDYRLRHMGIGSGMMFIAGSVSGLLGIGSGALKVPAMDLALGMPMKASSATSDFMIGVTAAASLGAYYARGQLVPGLVMPVALGAAIGSVVGTRLLARLHNRWIQGAFLLVLLAMAGEMIAQGLRR
jgi:uncharacterized membrane protein YfcA